MRIPVGVKWPKLLVASAVIIGGCFYFRDSLVLQKAQNDDDNKSIKSLSEFDLYRVHPFESTCKYPIPKYMMQDIDDIFMTARIRSYACNIDQDQWAQMDDEGYIWINTKFALFPHKAQFSCRWTKDGGHCQTTVHGGGLRPRANGITNGKVHELKPYKRILINSDVFSIQCWNTSKVKVFDKMFLGMKHLDKPEGEIFYVDDRPEHDAYGRRKDQFIERDNRIRGDAEKQNEERNRDADGTRKRISINILGLDSTARNQFIRHSPKSWPYMQELGFHTMYGYVKVGDNSEPNICALFAGDFPQAMNHSKTENVTGDINWDWIMPMRESLDADTIPFLWKYAKEKYNYTTMLNDDIGSKERGLFHYTPQQFKPGFTKQPTDHWFRPYYSDFYKHVKRFRYVWCKDGEIVQHIFMDQWRKFAIRYKDTPSFQFNFVTTQAHDFPFNHEIMDQRIYESLLDMNAHGIFNKSINIILGDHGNRMNRIKFTYTGVIEERMPLFAISFPPWFQKEYPAEYQNFLDNRWKLISNYDIHKTLRDILDLNIGPEREKETPGRGISLFNEIPLNRSCWNCTIATNFCTCLVDKSAEIEPQPGRFTNKTLQIENSLRVLREWLQEESIDCVLIESVSEARNVSYLGLHSYVRSGIRRMLNINEVNNAKWKHHNQEYLIIEFLTSLRLSTGSTVEVLSRVEHYVRGDAYSMHFEPMVIGSVGNCEEKYLKRLCNCINRH